MGSAVNSPAPCSTSLLLTKNRETAENGLNNVNAGRRAGDFLASNLEFAEYGVYCDGKVIGAVHPSDL